MKKESEMDRHIGLDLIKDNAKHSRRFRDAMCAPLFSPLKLLYDLNKHFKSSIFKSNYFADQKRINKK
jgi:hypothetical protein